MDEISIKIDYAIKNKTHFKEIQVWIKRADEHGDAPYARVRAKVCYLTDRTWNSSGGTHGVETFKMFAEDFVLEEFK